MLMLVKTSIVKKLFNHLATESSSSQNAGPGSGSGPGPGRSRGLGVIFFQFSFFKFLSLFSCAIIFECLASFLYLWWILGKKKKKRNIRKLRKEHLCLFLEMKRVFH